VNAYYFVLGVLTVWRVTHLLHAEDGPWDIVVRLRRVVGNGVVGQAMDCFYCLSLWISLPVALLIGFAWFERTLLWFGLSGAAILLERVTNRQPINALMYREELEPPQPSQTPKQEDHDAMLR
jgi:hypothetical protein